MPSVRVVLVLLLCVATGWGGEPPATRSPGDVLRGFRGTFKAHKGYMRPAGDAGWKARQVALRDLARAGKQAAPALREALRRPETDVRVLAAQALSWIGDAAALEDLAGALRDDPDAPVRIYAAEALGILRLLPGGEGAGGVLARAEKTDASGDVRAHARFALERRSLDDWRRARAGLCRLGEASLATARLGEPAPAFRLESHRGTTVSLGDYRGKSVVVLVFIYGDT